jgi:hypothetical protein
MPKTSLVSKAAALLAAALSASLAHATARPLSDAEMSAVRGADGTLLAPITGAGGDSSQNALANGLAAAFSSSTGSTTLTPAQFAAALAADGYTTAMVPGYNGQPVAQTRVDAPPVTFSFSVSDLIPGLGGTLKGPSMGTITLTNFDARGTTLWVWTHH